MSSDDAALLRAAHEAVPGPDRDYDAPAWSFRPQLLTMLGAVTFLGMAYLVIEWFNR